MKLDVTAVEKLTKATIIRKFVLVSLGRSETALRSIVNFDWVPLGEKCGGYFGVGLGHRVTVDHSTDVPSIAWNLLPADLVGRACDPIDSVLARRSEHVLVDLGAGRKVNCACHGLLESDSAHCFFLSSRHADLSVDGAGRLAELIVLQGDVSCVAWEVLAGPEACGLRSMFRRL